MTDSFCGYRGDRDQALVACLYEEHGEAGERALFEDHLATCARCLDELAALRGVRAQLARWAPPEPAFNITDGNGQSAHRNPATPWWREIPAWAQVAAALLFLGVSAGIANLDVRYDASGLNVRTGWMPPAAGAGAGSRTAPAAGVAADGAAAPWRADLAALERQLKDEVRTIQTSSRSQTMQTPPASRVAATPDAEVLRLVHAIVDESEKRQQRELALRVAEVMRDVTAQRRTDLVNIDRMLGFVQDKVGVEVMKDRQRLDLLYRASQRQ
jgi:hypothetical protein